MGNGPSKPVDTPGDDDPEDTPTSTRSTRTPIGPTSSSDSSSLTLTTTTTDAATETTESASSTSSDTPLPTVETTSTPPIVASPTPQPSSTSTTTDPASSPTGTLVGVNGNTTTSGGGGPSIVAIVVPFVIVSALVGALVAVFFMRRRRRQQSHRLIEDFHHGNNIMPAHGAGDDQYYAPTRPYAPEQHLTYSPPSVTADPYAVYDTGASAYASAGGGAYGGVAYPAMQQQQPMMYGAAALHPGWAPPHSDADAQSFRSHTTAGFAGLGAHPLSPAGPMPVAPPSAWAVPPPAAVARQASVRSVGTVASDTLHDRRELRITNARSDASLQPPVSPAAGPRGSKAGGEELGEDVLKAWMQN